jgi:hypothetical protein
MQGKRPTIKDFATLQGDARRKVWRIDQDNYIRIKMTQFRRWGAFPALSPSKKSVA